MDQIETAPRNGPDGPKLEVRLFGGPALLKDGEEVPLSPLQMHLLAAVYGSGSKGITRSELAWLLWQSDAGPRVRHRISSLIYKIGEKAGVGGVKVVKRTHDTLTPAAPHDLLDHFHDGSRRAASLRSLSSLMSRLERPPTAPMAQWLDRRRATLRTKLHREALRGLQESADRGQWAVAQRIAQELLDIDPDNQFALQHLQAAVIARRDRLTAQELVSRYGALVEQNRELLALATFQPSSHQASTVSAGTKPPLLGRDAELGAVTSEADRCLTEATRRQILVLGEAGIGKTALVTAALQRLRARGFLPLFASATEFNTGIALAPLLEAISSPAVEHLVHELPQGLQDTISYVSGHDLPSPSPIDGASVHFGYRVAEAFFQLFALLAARQPLVVAIDDYQWCDLTTLSVVQHVTRRWGSLPLLLLISARRSEQADASPQLKLGRQLAYERGTTLDLRELPFDAALQLAQHASADGLSASEASKICSIAQCHPLFITELAAQADERPESPSNTGSTLQDLIHQRYANSPTELRLLLAIVALWRGPIEAERLSALCEVPYARCLDLIDQGLARRFLEVRGGLVEVRHDIFRESVIETLSEGMIQLLHRKIADSLLGSKDEPDVALLATHFIRAKDTPRAVEFALTAAAQAASRGAIPEAIAVLEDAEILEERRNPKLRRELARLRYLHSDLALAIPLLKEAESDLRQSGEVKEAIRFGVWLQSALSETNSAPHDQCVRALQKLGNEAESLRSWNVHSQCIAAQIRALERMDDVRAIKRLLEDFTFRLTEGGQREIAHALAIMSIGALYGDPQVAADCSRRAVILAEELGEPQLMITAYSRRLFVMLYQGGFALPDGVRLSNQVMKLARDTGDLKLQHKLRLYCGIWHMDTGELDLAQKHFEKARQLVENTAAAAELQYLLTNEGELALREGNLDGAYRKFADADAMMDSGAKRITRDVVSAGLGLAALRLGRRDEAKARHKNIRTYDQWYFDPSLIAELRAELLRANGNAVEAAVELGRTASAIEHRFPVQSVALRVKEVRLWNRIDRDRARGITEAALPIAETLGLSTRIQELRALS